MLETHNCWHKCCKIEIFYCSYYELKSTSCKISVMIFSHYPKTASHLLKKIFPNATTVKLLSYSVHNKYRYIPGTGGYLLPHLFVIRNLHSVVSESISWNRLHTNLKEWAIHLASKYEQMWRNICNKETLAKFKENKHLIIFMGIFVLGTNITSCMSIYLRIM